jgi:hypothetical protein
VTVPLRIRIPRALVSNPPGGWDFRAFAEENQDRIPGYYVRFGAIILPVRRNDVPFTSNLVARGGSWVTGIFWPVTSSGWIECRSMSMGFAGVRGLEVSFPDCGV